MEHDGADSAYPMRGKVCLITGANSGIGKATALELAQMGAQVVMVCRDLLRGTLAQTQIMWETGNNNVDLMVADISSLEQIRRLAEQFKHRYDRLDVLVNNAGIAVWNLAKSVDGIEITFATNYLGHFLLTNLLLDTLKDSAPARIINLSSIAHTLTNRIDYGHLKMIEGLPPLQAYAQSKLATLMFTYELAQRLKRTGVTVNAVDPWVAKTNLANQVTGTARILRWIVMNLLATSVNKGAETVIYLANSPHVNGISGKYFFKCKPKASSKCSYDQQAWQRLRMISEDLTCTSMPPARKELIETAV
jgi:NAD(P)-dependent dehydrogenase (short-subunit alcohol dehydrogenase family)